MTPILMQDETILGFLQECLSCVVTEERNGIFELTLSYPVTGSLFQQLQIDSILKVKPNDTADLQLFRIYEVEKPMNGIVIVNAEHISYALAGYPVSRINQTGTATQAISAVLSSADYHLHERFAMLEDTEEEAPLFPFRVSTTDMVAIKDFNFTVGSAREALGGKEGSILDVYGGEYEFDNYTIKLHSHRGRDTGIVIGYGKNMTDIKATTSMESAYTGLFPYATKGDKTITASYSYFDADTMRFKEHKNICRVENKAGIADRILLKDFSNEFDNDEEFTPQNLAAKADAWLLENDINSPTVNVTVSFIHLWQSPEYAQLEALEKVSLCDTVLIRHQELGIDMKAQVIKTVYDTLAERYQSIELGSARANFQDTWKQTTDTLKKLVDSVNPDGISSQITKEYLAAIDSATKKITGAEYGVVKLNPSTYPRELLIMDNELQSEAKNIWRWNVRGLGFSSNGYDGPFSTAITSDGAIVADFITAGTLTANIIRAGILKSANGKSFFNLESGVIQTNNANITGGTIKIGSSDYYTFIANGSIEQFAEGNGTLVGGMVPAGSSNTYSQSIYFNGSTCDGLGISIRSDDGYFTHLLYVSDSAITMRRDTALYGDLQVFGKVSSVGLLTTGENIRIGGMVEDHLDVEKGVWLRNSSKEELGGLYDNSGKLDLFYNKAKISELDFRYSDGGYIYTIAKFKDSAIELYKPVTVEGAVKANEMGTAGGLKLLASQTSEFGGLWGQSSATYAYYVPSQSNGFCIASLSGDKFTSVASFTDKEAVIAGKLYADGYEVQSVEHIKDNIVEVDSSVFSAFKDSKIYAYILKTEAPTVAVERALEDMPLTKETSEEPMVRAAMESAEPESDLHTQYGFVIGRETPSELISEDGEHIDLYAMAALNWRATQEIIQRLEALENDHGRDDS